MCSEKVMVVDRSDAVNRAPSRFWIQEFWMMFRLHSSLSDSLEQFQELIRDLGQDHLAPLLETKWM
jgi:hypothetical protein